MVGKILHQIDLENEIASAIAKDVSTSINNIKQIILVNMADDEQVWGRISREQRLKGNSTTADKAAFLSGQAAYAKPSGALTPHWNLAQSQAMQAVNNIRFGVADDLTLQRQQMFQDISLSGISSDNKNRLMSSMESQIDPIIDRQLQLDTAQKVAEQDASADAAMRDIAPQIQGIMGDPSMSLEQKFQQTTALQMQYPELIGNKRVDNAFKATNESLRGQQWTRQMSGSSKSVIEQGLAKIASEGNVAGVKSLLGTLPEDQKNALKVYEDIAVAHSHNLNTNEDKVKRLLDFEKALTSGNHELSHWQSDFGYMQVELAVEAINDILGTAHDAKEFVDKDTEVDKIKDLLPLIIEAQKRSKGPNKPSLYNPPRK